MVMQYSEACERNKEPILEVLREVVPAGGRVLEVGCGTGQHAVHFAANLDGVTWQPADREGRLGSMRARAAQADLDNLQEPVALDLFDESWPVEEVDALVTINVLHIAPWEATERLFAHADELLEAGPLYVYGPFRYVDRPLEPSNERFDRMLRGRDPEMGLREAGAVAEHAADYGFELVEDRAMPANNRSLVFRRR